MIFYHNFLNIKFVHKIFIQHVLALWTNQHIAFRSFFSMFIHKYECLKETHTFYRFYTVIKWFFFWLNLYGILGIYVLSLMIYLFYHTFFKLIKLFLYKNHKTLDKTNFLIFPVRLSYFGNTFYRHNHNVIVYYHCYLLRKVFKISFIKFLLILLNRSTFWLFSYSKKRDKRKCFSRLA